MSMRVEKNLLAQRFTCLGAVEKQRWSLSWVFRAVGAEALPQAGFLYGLRDGEAGFPSPSMKGNLMLCGPEGDGLAEDGVSCIPSSTSDNSSDGK